MMSIVADLIVVRSAASLAGVVALPACVRPVGLAKEVALLWAAGHAAAKVLRESSLALVTPDTI